jgi:hypothetical protein
MINKQKEWHPATKPLKKKKKKKKKIFRCANLFAFLSLQSIFENLTIIIYIVCTFYKALLTTVASAV